MDVKQLMDQAKRTDGWAAVADAFAVIGASMISGSYQSVMKILDVTCEDKQDAAAAVIGVLACWKAFTTAVLAETVRKNPNMTGLARYAEGNAAKKWTIDRPNQPPANSNGAQDSGKPEPH